MRTKSDFETTHCLKHLETNWFLQICEFLIQSNSQISVDNLWTQKTSRQNDKFIMDEIRKIDLPKKKLQIFNHWRLYFQVSRLSDITNASGDKILNRYIFNPDEVIAYKHSKSILSWPHQGKPDKESFSIWKNILQHIFELNENRLPNVFKLGSWIDTIETQDRKWEYYWAPSTGVLYRSTNNNEFQTFSNIYAKYQICRFGTTQQDLVQELPSDGSPIDVSKTRLGKQISLPKKNTRLQCRSTEEETRQSMR